MKKHILRSCLLTLFFTLFTACGGVIETLDEGSLIATSDMTSILENPLDSDDVFSSDGMGPESSSPPRPENSTSESSAHSNGEASASAPTAEESKTKERQLLKLVVPEGYTLARIGMTLESMDVCTVDEFITAAQTGDFSEFSVVAAQTPNANRCFKLEGYLFPATYEFYDTETPDQIIRRMLQVTEAKFTPELRQKISATGFSIDEIITLASIIEKEAFGRDYMSDISAVFHNRIDKGMRLQSDVTIIYVEGAIKPFISGDINRYNGYYNTYKTGALPAGAVSNPGMRAIMAAIEPSNHDYYYFLTDDNKNFYFAETYEEHQENEKLVGIDKKREEG